MCILKVEVFSVIFFPLPAFTSFLHSCFCFCIHSQFIPSFSSSGSNDTIYVGFAAGSLLVPKNKEAKCQILLTFHGLLLLKNRRGRETTARLVGFFPPGLGVWLASFAKTASKVAKSGRN